MSFYSKYFICFWSYFFLLLSCNTIPKSSSEGICVAKKKKSKMYLIQINDLFLEKSNCNITVVSLLIKINFLGKGISYTERSLSSEQLQMIMKETISLSDFSLIDCKYTDLCVIFKILILSEYFHHKKYFYSNLLIFVLILPEKKY